MAITNQERIGKAMELLCTGLAPFVGRRKRAAEALAYNGLVQSWPEITRLAREIGKGGPAQAEVFTA